VESVQTLDCRFDVGAALGVGSECTLAKTGTTHSVQQTEDPRGYLESSTLLESLHYMSQSNSEEHSLPEAESRPFMLHPVDLVRALHMAPSHRSLYRPVNGMTNDDGAVYKDAPFPLLSLNPPFSLHVSPLRNLFVDGPGSLPRFA
jgi:hypothetical protein